MSKVLLLVLLLFVTCSYAGDYITIAGLSRHFDTAWVRKPAPCEVNPGVGYEKQLTQTVVLAVGVYQNSLCDSTLDFGVDWMPNRGNGFNFGVATRIFLGYGHPIGGPLPKMETPRIPLIGAHVNAYLVPGFLIDKRSVLALELAWELK